MEKTCRDILTLYKFTPELLTKKELEDISIGRDELVDYAIDKILSVTKNKNVVNFMFVGPRGIGKTHLLLQIRNKLEKIQKITLIKLSEEEYSITNLQSFLSRIMDIAGEKVTSSDIIGESRQILKRKQSEQPVVIFIENLQMLFKQMSKDLPKLRSIMLEDKSFCIVGSATTTFEQITSPSKAFYNFFESIFLQCLDEKQIEELIKKRFKIHGKKDLIKLLENDKSKIKGLQILTGGLPRLIHILSDIVIQKESFDDIESNLFELLDELTPAYQSRMETMSLEKRRLLDTIALADGPQSPTEISEKLKITKTANVVTQLSRLKEEGYIEQIKFKDKKAVRYQVSDRLYRIWRVMRTSGRDNISLFIQFLSVWYSKDELMKKLQKKSHEVDSLIRIDKKRASLAMKDSCKYMNALDDESFSQIRDMIQNFARLEQYEDAENELTRLEKTINLAHSEILKTVMKFLIDVSHLELQQYQSDVDVSNDIHSCVENLLKISIDKKINKQLSDNELIKIHILFQTSADYMLYFGLYESAEKCNRIAMMVTKDFCLYATSLHAIIKMRLKQYDESLKLADKVLKHDPKSIDALSVKTLIYALKNKPEEMKNVGNLLLQESIMQLVVIDQAYDTLELYDDFLKILSEKEIDKLKFSQKTDLLEALLHQMIHQLHNKIKNEDPKQIMAIKLKIKKLQKYFDSHSFTRYLFATIIHVAPNNDFHIISTLYNQIKEILTKENLTALLPFDHALNFIESEDSEILEKLHKENRQLVINIIKMIRPTIVLSKQVEESILY